MHMRKIGEIPGWGALVWNGPSYCIRHSGRMALRANAAQMLQIWRPREFVFASKKFIPLEHRPSGVYDGRAFVVELYV